MKKHLTSILLALFSLAISAQNTEYVYTEAADLTLIGKLMPGKTQNPYHRVDTTLYKGFNKRENLLVRMSSGMGCVFKTNSKSISILTTYGQMDDPSNTSIISARGYDLYIKEGEKWVWAASGVSPRKYISKPLELLSNMDGSEHTCLLYFPTYSEVRSIKIGVEKGSAIEKIDNPFKHRIAIWGSSFTHGSCTSRSGMTYPAQFSRSTGLQMLSLGCSGWCILQDSFCNVLTDVDADAFIFDTFSNPSASLIRKRLIPFIDRMIAAHPNKPLIFQQTIYRERRNYNIKEEQNEQAKMDMAAKIFKEIKSTPEGRKKYKDVYFIIPNACPESHEGTVDGIHPDNYGYTVWTKSIEKNILKILKKYGIRHSKAS